jgi:hypothetical protein
MNKQVNVLRHDDIGPDVDLVAATGTIDSFDEPCAGSVLGQKGQPMETTESQLVGVSRLVPSRAGFVFLV